MRALPTPAEPAPVHERIEVGQDRQVKVDWYGNGGTLYVGLLYPGRDKAKATVRLTVGQARELVAAVDAACDAIVENVEAYHARQELEAA